MRRDAFESRYNSWEGRQLVAVITPKSCGRTALRVQWAGLEEIREAAAVDTSWAACSAGNPAETNVEMDIPPEGFDAFDAVESHEVTNTDSGNNTSDTSVFDKVEDFVKAVVVNLNKDAGTLCFGFPNGDFMVAAESAGRIDPFALIAKTIETINDAWEPETFGKLGWEMPSIYVDYSGKP